MLFDLVIADTETIALEELAAEVTIRGAPTSYAEARTRFLGIGLLDRLGVDYGRLAGTDHQPLSGNTLARRSVT